MLRIPALLLCTLLNPVVTPAPAQDLSPAEELLAFERLREEVESAFNLCTDPPAGLHDRKTGCTEASRRLVAIGPDVIPFVENELSQETQYLEFLALNVLGLMPSEETAGTLKAVIQRYDRMQVDKRTRMMKLYALLALALQGDPTVVDLTNSGKTHLGLDMHLYARTNALVVMSVLIGPDSLPRLMKQIALYREDDRYLDHLIAAATALSQVAEPDSFETLSSLLSHPEWAVRMAVVDGFRRLGDRRSVDRLIGILNDEEDRRIRVSAAQALARLKPVYAYEPMLAVLEKETFYPVRGILYQTIAQIGKADAVPALLQNRGHKDPNDRRLLVTALGWTGNHQALPVIRQGLRDDDNGVAFAALDALNRIGTAGAVDSMLSALNHPNVGVAIVAAELLVKKGEPRVAPRILSRLLTGILAGDARPLDRDPVRLLGQALVDLQYTEARQEITAALKRQTDASVRNSLEKVAGALSLIETNGNDVNLWADNLEQKNHDTLSLAIANLGRIGTGKAVSRLLARFEEFDLDHKLATVRHLDRADPDQVADLLEAIMTSEEYNPPRYSTLRAVAAWTAARIGGERMADLLLAASERVQGANLFYQLYLMKAVGKEALPHLAATRIPRLRQADYWRWQETQVLETVADDLRAGVHHPLLDTPPEKVEIQHL